jgi:hypothetical protein
MRLHGCLLLAALVACGHGDPAEGAQDASADGSAVDLGPCADAGVPPSTLACTGLYVDIAAKTITPGVRSYAPAASFWADGADKSRWIELPDGGVIDDTDPNEWVFPVGTKVWKEFRRDGRRVETRLFQKARSNLWVDATYLWSADESGAVRSFGADIPLSDGATYHVPSPDECQRCHRGRNDHVLGFDAVLLGLPGASGTTLADLVAEARLAPPPASTSLTIGDDGTGRDGPALAWLHANCGVCCHNTNSNAEAFGAGMHLRLDPTTLDGRSALTLAPERTTVGVGAISPSWSGQPRIAPGHPDASLIVQLTSHRGDGEQMPPLATTAVDTSDVAALVAWIAAMPAEDAGVGDAGQASDGGKEPDAGDAGEAYDAGEAGEGTDASDAGEGTDAGDAGKASDAGEARDASRE